MRDNFLRLLEHLADGVVVVDANGLVRYANRAAATLFGRTTDALVGAHFGYPMVGGETTIVDVLASAGPKVAEMRVVDLEWESERAFLASLRDISERLELEEARIARKFAEAAARQREELLAVVSHEMRTPIQAVISWAMVLKSSLTDTATIERAVDAIERSARAQARMIDDLLDLSRLEIDKMELDRQTLDLREIVQPSIESFAPQAADKGLELRVAKAPDQPIPVCGDADRLSQVLRNLLSNALKFTPEGGCIDVAMGSDGERAMLIVRDDGCGIPPEHLTELFDRFARAGDPQIEGLGIGLSLVRAIVELHDGSVEALSDGLGEGATFKIYLPLGAC